MILILGTPYDNINNEYWNGKWFPHAPSEIDSNPVSTLKKSHLHDPNHGIIMGIQDANCDDAKVDYYCCFQLDLFFKPFFL